jgi:hypothetical protein
LAGAVFFAGAAVAFFAVAFFAVAFFAVAFFAVAFFAVAFFAVAFFAGAAFFAEATSAVFFPRPITRLAAAAAVPAKDVRVLPAMSEGLQPCFGCGGNHNWQGG